MATERIGPFPDRVRDVGVIKDLATHDLDLVRWLGGAPVERVSAETQHRMGRGHEDLVLATGRLENAISFNCVVDWLSPTKVRQTRVLGERGMLVADTLTADLTFYRNGKVASEWANTQSLRGVSEGDSTRYALARREPLLVELETFCDLLEGDADAAVVTLSEGLETVLVAEAALASARPARPWCSSRRPREGSRRRAGQDRPAARHADRPRRARGDRLRHRRARRSSSSTPAQPPFPGEEGLAEALAEVVGDGRLRATTDTTAAVAEGAELVVAVPPLVVDADARPDWGTLDAVLRRHRRRPAGRARRWPSRRRCRSVPRARASRPRWPATAACARRTSSSASSAPSASTAAACSATSRPTPSCSAASARPARRAASSSTAASWTPRCGRWAPPRRPS